MLQKTGSILQALKNLFENHKFVRRIVLFWWMCLFTYATIQVFKAEPEPAAYSILAGISGLMMAYYFYSRSSEK